MAIDLATLSNIGPSGSVETSIGELCVFDIRLADEIALGRELGKPIGKCDPFEFARQFVRQTCCKRQALRDGKYRPDMPSMSADDVTALSEADLDAIADDCVAHNDYLFRKQVSKKSVDAAGKEVVSVKYGKVEHPRKEKETASQYLQRLVAHQNETRRKTMERMFGFPLKGIESFSPSLGNSIRGTLSLGESLMRDWEATRAAHTAYAAPILPAVPGLDGERLERLSAEASQTPLRELAGRLDRLIERSAEQGGFLVNANEIQTRIAAEIKASGNVTEKASKMNVRLTSVVIVLTLLGAAVSLYTVVQSGRDSQVQRREITKHVDRLSKGLSDIGASFAAPGDSLRRANQRMSEALVNQRREIGDMKRHLESQGIKLRELEDRLKRNPPDK